MNDDELNFIDRQSDQAITKSTIAWCAKEAIFKWWSFGNVDFRKNILLQNFYLEKSGEINARFKKENENFFLNLNYKVFNELCLVWIADRN